MSTTLPISYQVLITPLVAPNTYGTTLDVTQDIDLSDYIKEGGIGRIIKEIDNGDYDIGIFTYGNITMRAINIDGKFNDECDHRSIFFFKRDLAKVNIKFIDSDSDATISFKGLINEEGTRQDFLNNEVKFKVLSQDSVIRKTKISAGAITAGNLFSIAIKEIINVPEITSVLTYDASKITPNLDLTIDDASFFDNANSKDALDELLLASNSIMLIDSNDTMVVQSRVQNQVSAFNFYGPGDVLGRENIINIKNYNNGLHRTFNSVIVNDQEKNNTGLVSVYGLRQKSIALTFITDTTKAQTIAANILNEFKAPKTEMEIVTTTEIAKELQLFDLVSIDNNYRRVPSEGLSLPLYGAAKYGTAVYPIIQGNLKISPNIAYKVIGFEENPRKFLTTTKLRERGIGLGDGPFNEFIALYGTAIYGASTYTLDSERIDPGFFAYYGGAEYGLVRYGGVLS